MTYADELRAAQDAAVESYISGLLTASADQIEQLTAERDAAQQRVSSLETSLADANAQIASLTQSVADLQAKLDVCESQQPASQPLAGATLRGTSTSASAVKPRPTWDIVRTFNNTDMQSCFDNGKGRRVATSYGSYLGGPGWSADAATVNGLKTQLSQIPDVPGNWVADTHEFDNPDKYGTNAVQYLADAAVFAQTVRAVNATRKNPLKIFRCSMSYSITQPARNIDAFYTQDPQNYDAYGPDVYNPANVTRVVEKAKLYGKPLVIPEFGPMDAVAPVDYADPLDAKTSIYGYMQYCMSVWSDLALWACWFDKRGATADLDQYPKSLEYWTSNVAG